MKKTNIQLFFIVGMLVLSGLGAAAIPDTEDSNNESNITILTESFNVDLSKPIFSDKDEFVKIELDQSETFMSHSGEPMLPVITKTFSFPIGTKINNINVGMDWKQYTLDRKITPTPVIVPISLEIDPEIIEEKKINEAIYSSKALYPSEPYKTIIGTGIKDMEHVTFVNVKCYPQYSPANDYINIPTNIQIDVEYEPKEPLEQSEDAEQYDLIIITHDLFEDELLPLVAHKESLGITTKMVTVDEIYDQYQGVADWEEIKMYLFDHVLQWDTKYVLLAGGHKGQTHEWYVPNFGSHNFDPTEEYDPPYDFPFSADLYFATIYRTSQSGELMMDTWDSNGNGIYGEGPSLPSGTDDPDFYPDVYVGRLPFRYEWESTVAVDKIIDYENNADDSWFKKAVLAGGDGFPPERYGGSADPDLWEGEIVCNAYAELLANRGVVSTKCYCSDYGDIKVRDASDVYNEVSKGCGFVHLTGHANPFSLGSYEPYTGITDPEPPLTDFYTGFNVKEYDCENKLPFMVNEGCHNAQFDVTGQDLIDYLVGASTQFLLLRFEWIPHDASSWLVLQKDGGAIAVIGNTALGLGGLNEGCTEFVGGWINLRFAEAWGVDGLDYIGPIWATGINGYIDNFDVYDDSGDRKTIEERAIIGDPSIKLGGYGPGVVTQTDEPEENYNPVLLSVPTWSVGESWTYALDNIDIDLTLIEGRGVTLKLSSGDIVLEVTDIKSDSYVASLTADDIDVTIGGTFDFYAEDVEDITIPTISLDNVRIDGELLIDKETLGINEIDLVVNFDLAENLENLANALQIQLPNFIYTLAPFMSIPGNINLNVEFDNPFEIIQFPLETEKIWGFPENSVAISIDGSIQSVWLRLLSLINRFIPIIPAEFAQYLPNIDISDILEDFGIETQYQFDFDIGAGLFPYHTDTTPIFEVMGSETINVEAGQYDATRITIIDNNADIYYSESEGTIIKIVAYTSEYIPIIDDINLELKD